MNQIRLQIRYFALGELTGAPFNPANRTAQKNLQPLIDGIVELGYIVQPIIASKDLRIIDGHRRWAAAKMMGLKEVPAIITPLSLQTGWRILNGTTLKIAAKDWVQAHYTGLSIQEVPKNRRREIETIKRLIGDDGFATVAESYMSSGVASESRYVAKYIENKQGRHNKCSDYMHREVLLWMIECGQQAHAKAAVKNEMSRNLLKFAVEKREHLHK